MRTMIRNRTQDDGGFTLVELLVVMLIMGIVGAFTMTSLVQGLQVSNDADRRIQALTDLQQSGQRVSRELRMACLVTTASPDVAVLDLLRDGTRYRYRIEATPDGVLQADVDSVASDGTTTDVRVDRIAEDIKNADTLFAYTGSDGAAVTVPSQVRNVTMTLRRQAADDVVEWTGDLHLRNGGLSCGF